MASVSRPGPDTAVGPSRAVGGISGFYALDAESNPPPSVTARNIARPCGRSRAACRTKSEVPRLR